MANFAVLRDFGLPNRNLSKKLIWTPYNCQKTTYYLVRHMRGAASELGFMHSGAIVEGDLFARIIACVFCPQSMLCLKNPKLARIRLVIST